jgi:hypothetical protein
MSRKQLAEGGYSDMWGSGWAQAPHIAYSFMPQRVLRLALGLYPMGCKAQVAGAGSENEGSAAKLRPAAAAELVADVGLRPAAVAEDHGRIQ